MRLLTLFRHGHAERAQDGESDFERALDKRGRRETKQMSRHLAGLDWQVDHLITSPAVRTIDTARALARALGFPLERIRHDDRVYLAEADLLLGILRAAPAAARHVLLVGHNPGLSILAGRLDATAEPDELPTAAAYALQFRIREWTALDWRTGERVLYASPATLEDAR